MSGILVNKIDVKIFSDEQNLNRRNVGNGTKVLEIICVMLWYG